METIITNLLEKPDKAMKIKEWFLVKEIELRNELDQIRLDLQQDKIEYKGLVMEKGHTFPIPKVNDILFIEEICLKYSQEFQFKLYIKGKVDNKNENIIFGKINKCYSFEYSYIFDTLSTFTHTIVFKNNSSIFRIINFDKDNAQIKNISNSKIYLIKKLDTFKKNDFLWIYNYEINETNFIKNKLTTLEILNEKKLFRFLDGYFSDKNITIFEVIDIDNDCIILINNQSDIYELDNGNNIINKYKINFCSLIIIANYTLKEKNKIELKDDTFIYKFEEKFYYLEDTLINSYTVIKLFFLDYVKDKNIFDTISYQFEEKKINNENEYIIISSSINKKYDYYPFELTLLNSEDQSISPVSFNIYLYQSLMNKINVFLNTKSSKTYFFEYFFYNINDELGKIEKSIKVNDEIFNINIFDSFGSVNRKRISIMNIPYQENEVLEEEITGNSIQISELIRGNIHKIIGIYNISFFEMNNEEYCEYFDNYYENFGDIYDMIIHYNTENSEIIINTIKTRIRYINFKIIKEVDKIDLTKANFFENSMTLSQFKTRVGLIICKYINDNIDKINDVKLDKIIHEIYSIFKQIKEENLEYSDIIRILLFTLEEIVINNSSSKLELKLISKLNENSPYLLAYNFNKELITSLDEFNAFFQAYLQLDSYQSFNYIHNMETYSFSLELVFMIKYHLLFTYDKFFYVKREKGNEFAYLDTNTKITVINEYKSFGPNFDEKEISSNPEKAKNYAFPLSLHFLHENNGHYKYDLKNDNFNASCLYFKGLKIQLETEVFDNILIGENGRMIENFISENKIIIQILSTKLIFGEFLKKEYFDKKDFKKLINNIIQKLESNKEENIVEKNNTIQTSHQAEKNIKVFQESNDQHHLVQIGDMILNINKVKRNALVSKQEKEESFKKCVLNRQKKLRILKKIRKENNEAEN